ncbi:hypothetical protein KDA_63330 [Dictyobacter alpinus]|uniref:Uncharacterized protein n=1 Tax=Dictyobacter alpinus TaxID=2014873 RepID=A0A402BHP6_9CHLR|nr:FUSC family protein [Dictyobacter alpinus]GCE30849.1 hypothetical protein KDA_63330 [Dictyobacter alpinus]
MHFVYSSSKTFLKHIHTNLSLDRPTIINGLRMTGITVIPILVGMLLHAYELGVMCFLSGLYVALADVGGTYRSRAFAMGTATVGVALAAFVATLTGSIIWLAVPLMFLFAFGFSMLGVFGNIGSKVGFVIIGIFILILGQPADFTHAVERLLAFIAGGLWAMLLTLYLWPIQPLQPIRRALADYYHAVSTFLMRSASMQRLDSIASDQHHWNEAVSQERTRVLAAHDQAHTSIVSFRSARQGASPIGQSFMLLTLTADRLFDASIALAEGIEIASTQTRVEHIHALLNGCVQQVSTLITSLAATIKAGRALDQALFQKELAILEEREAALRETLPRLVDDYAALVSVRNVIRLLRTVIEEVRIASGYLQSSAANPAGSVGEERQHRSISVWFKSLQTFLTSHWSILRDNMSGQSLIYRHSLRLAASTALAVAIYMLPGIHYGYWIPLTILFILKPDFGGMRKRANQRVFGTVMGGIIGTLIAGVVHNELILLFLLILIGFYAFSLLNADYGVYVAFLTLFVVLLLDVPLPGNWQVALIRIFNTVLGGVISVAAGYLICPQWERERLPVQLAKTIAANRQYFHCVLSAYLGEAGEYEKIAQAGRKVHLENSNAAVAFQRMLAEPKNKQGDVERFYALVTYNQHFSDRITTLATYLRSLSGKHRLPGLDSFTRQTEAALQTIEEAVLSGNRLSQLDCLEESLKVVQNSLQALITLRMNELASEQIDTPNREAIRDFVLVGSQLDRLTHDISGMSNV